MAYFGLSTSRSLLVRALRDFETARDAAEHPTVGSPGEGARPTAPSLRACIEAVIADVRPSAHTERLELMDLVAVKECTDTRFLPERYRAMPMTEVNQRIERLKLALGE